MKRELLTLGCASVAMLISAMPSATADSSAARVTGSTIDSVLLSGDTVGDILGTNLPVQQKAKRPMPVTQLEKNQECGVLFGPDTIILWTQPQPVPDLTTRGRQGSARLRGASERGGFPRRANRQDRTQ
jgi:hypothetical protein